MPTCFIFAENSSIKAIAPHIEQLSLPIIGTATTFDEGFRLIMGFKPEIVFIDMIFVQRYSEELQLLKHKTSFVVVSDTTADAFAAFEFHALDFLLKPVKYTKLIKSIEKYQSIEARFAFGQKVNPEIQDYFYMKTDTKGIKEVKIFYKDIVYIEAQHNHVIVYLGDNKQHVVFNTMKDMEENLPFALFSRIHKSFIINDDKISYIEGNAVILNDNTKLKIVIGNTFRKAFIEKKNRRVIKGYKSKSKEEIMVGLLLPLSLVLTELVSLINELNFL